MTTCRRFRRKAPTEGVDYTCTAWTGGTPSQSACSEQRKSAGRERSLVLTLHLRVYQKASSICPGSSGRWHRAGYDRISNKPSIHLRNCSIRMTGLINTKAIYFKRRSRITMLLGLHPDHEVARHQLDRIRVFCCPSHCLTLSSLELNRNWPKHEL